jgi:hypothetical protein
MLTNEEYEFCMHKKGMSGSFMESLIQTMYKADTDNLNLLGKGYPGLAQVVKRYQSERGYWKDVVERWNKENTHSPLIA